LGVRVRPHSIPRKAGRLRTLYRASEPLVAPGSL